MAKHIYYVFNHTKQQDVPHNWGYSGYTEKQLIKAIKDKSLFLFNEGDDLVVYCFQGCKGSLEGLHLRGYHPYYKGDKSKSECYEYLNLSLSQLLTLSYEYFK